MAGETLESVDKELFARVWAVVQEIGEEERHFNNLQTVYRTMASTWLLSSFGAMGYVLGKNMTSEVSSELLIGCIGLVGCIGIVLLWVLDILIYQKLLGSCFVEGYDLEDHYRWLPPVRHNMWVSQDGRGIQARIIAFYLLPAVLLAVVGVVALSLWLSVKHGGCAGIGSIVLGLLATGVLVRWMRSKIGKGETMHERIAQLRKAVDAERALLNR